MGFGGGPSKAEKAQDAQLQQQIALLKEQQDEEKKKAQKRALSSAQRSFTGAGGALPSRPTLLG